MINIKVRFDYFFVFVFFYVLSCYFMPLYLYGDQVHYRKVYEAIGKTGNLASDFELYKRSLGGGEVVHFVLIKCSSFLGLSKDFIMSLSNAMLFSLAYLCAKNLTKNMLISFLLVVTNYYLYVLAFSAERLKFGFVFLFLSVLFSKRRYVVLSVMSHLQMGIMVLANLSSTVLDAIVKVIYTKRVSKSLLWLCLLLFLFIPLVFYYTNIYEKISIYAEINVFSIISLLKVFVFFVLSMTSMDGVSRRKAWFPLALIGIACFILGTDRVLILFWFFSAGYCLRYNNGINLFVIFSILYYSYSSIRFLSNIILYNDGFNL